jgi:quercetin dioxygenase-like cupin family protein
MKYWTLAASCAAFAFAAGCACEPAAPGNGAAATPAGKPGLTKQRIVSTEATMTGQPLRVPPPPVQLVVTRVDAPAGAVIACHKHPWSRYVYLEAGAVRVTNYDANRTNDFTAGQELVEAVGQWHDARVTSPGPARLIVVDQVPPGTGNQVDAPPAGPSPCTTRR